MLCILQKTNGEVKLGFNGDLYPTSGASVVMTTKGDMVDYNTARQRLGIGSANQILQVKSSLPSWETVDLADTVLTTAGDVLYEDATPALARLPKGTQYNNLQMGSALPAWSASSTSVLTDAMDILYSSSANTLARLGAGTSGDVLTTKGTGSAPTWETPSAGGGNLSLIEHMILTSDETSMNPTWTALNQGSDMAGLYAVFNGARSNSTGFYIRLNGISDSTYTYAGLECKAGTVTASDNSSNSVLEPYLGGGSSAVDHIMFQMFWSAGSSTLAANGDKVIRWSCLSVTDEADLSHFAGINTTEPITSLDEIEVMAASGNILDGSTLDVYKVTVA